MHSYELRSILDRSRDLISALPLKDLRRMPPAIKLPANLKNFAQIYPPRFEYGEIVRWVGVGKEADWGIVIGNFYNYEPRGCCWVWCYIIWLAADSKSVGWCQFDTAREEDLEVFEDEKAAKFDK
jgi:hypothetical protein